MYSGKTMQIEDNVEYSIVIPCYNELNNIPEIINSFQKVLEGDKDTDSINKNNFELILVDNGSSDGTYRLMHELAMNIPYCKIVFLEKNEGYGGGICKGLDQAKGKYIGWTHADMQTDPYDVIKAFEICSKSTTKNLFIKGRRRGRPLIDRVFSRGMGIFESLIFLNTYDDVNAQPTVFSKTLYNKQYTYPVDFSLDLYVYWLAKKLKFDLKRFDVRFGSRLHGQSSWNHGLKSKCKFIVRTLKYSLTLRMETL